MPADRPSRRPPASRPRLSAIVAAVLLAVAAPVPAAAEDRRPGAPTPPVVPRYDGPQVVGGTMVSRARWRDNFRWIVSVQRNGSHWCGGSLIARRYVLTAAHCVENWPFSAFSVLVNTPDSTTGGMRIAVEGVVVHPDYSYVRRAGFSSTGLDIDFAVLRLARTAPTSVPVVRLGATSDITGGPQLNGLRGWGLGWGATSEGGQGSARLMQVQVPVLSRANCQQRYAGVFFITTNMLCAGLVAGGRDTCQGDSGGPFAQQDAQGDWIQLGVTSFGLGCARPNRPGVYARVANFRGWIRQASTRRGAACRRAHWPSHFRTPTLFDCFSKYAADEGSLGPIPIGFPVRLGDRTYESLYINTNGNLSFGGPLTTWLSQPLAEAPVAIAAPFWADIDTNNNIGQITYGYANIGGLPAFIVNWSEVRRWPARPDRPENTFQAMLIRRSASVVDIEFNYGQVHWNHPRGARVGVGFGPGAEAREAPGSGGPQSGLVDGSTTALVSSSNVGVPGRLRYRLRNGRF